MDERKNGREKNKRVKYNTMRKKRRKRRNREGKKGGGDKTRV